MEHSRIIRYAGYRSTVYEVKWEISDKGEKWLQISFTAFYMLLNARLPYSHSLAGILSTAWRKTGSTFVYTLLVRSDEECYSSLCVTAVETPFWARIEPKVLRRSWNLKLPSPSLSRILFHRYWLKRSLNIFSCSGSNPETYFLSSAMMGTDTGREPILFLVFLLVGYKNSYLGRIRASGQWLRTLSTRMSRE